MAKINLKVAKVAKKALADVVKQMTPEECMKLMPKAMEMMNGKAPWMQKMMGGESKK